MEARNADFSKIARGLSFGDGSGAGGSEGPTQGESSVHGSDGIGAGVGEGGVWGASLQVCCRG